MTKTPAFPRRAAIGLEVLLWASFALAPLLAPDHLLLLSQVAVLALFAISLDILIGHAGITSLGHAAFFGIGAYGASLLALNGWEEPLSGLFLSALAAGLAGLAMAPLVVRVHGLAQLMVTLALALLLHEGASRWRAVTGGDDGLAGFMIAPVFGVFEFDLFGVTAYGYALAVTAAGFLLARLIAASPFGFALAGLRQNPQRMAAIGTAGRARLTQAYAISAFLAGLAGALLAQTAQSVALESLSLQRSAEVLVILILGGVGSRYGALIGAVVYVAMRDWLAAMSPQYWMGWLGLVMILVVLLAPKGIVGITRALAARLAGPRRPRGEAPARARPGERAA
ncbi:branched-chain amino acid ABC transporter permease [Aureimonas populi]|uniref:Branched-chain amino acid ABC transporter permease n=1 Tax=Aureimonas populi TaxID=1701758 RepID=A0ABW5CPU0_9HYPH|nr:branched-chain amino acid ABC transporter permease [Aureimonas populi]